MSKFCVLTNTKEFKAAQQKFNLGKFTLELLLYHYYNNVVNSLDTFPSDDYIEEQVNPTIVTDDIKVKEFRDKNYSEEIVFDNIEDCKEKVKELRNFFSEDAILVKTNLDEKLVIKVANFKFQESERSILKRIEEQFERIRNLKVPVRNRLTDVFDKAWLRDNKQFKNFRHAFDTAKIDKNIRDRIIEGIKLNPDMFDGKTFDLIIEILTSGLTDNLKDIYNKSLERQVDTALEQHLMNYLKKYNIVSKEATPEEIIAELKEVYKDRDFEGFGLGAYDVLNKIIYLANNRNKITAPEEFAHAFVQLMGALRNEDFMFLNREVSKTDIYNQVYEQYKDIYVRKDGKPDLLMIRTEAIGQALAAAIVDRWDSQNESEERSQRDKSFFDKLIEWLEKILDLFKGAKRVSFNQLVTSIATDVLNNDHSRLQNYGNENFAKQEYQRTLDANPLALDYMQRMSKFGNVMTGSISVRYQGELYREGEDDLHDIDMIVPQSAHGIDLHSFIVRQTALNTRKANPILLNYVKNTDYFKKVLKEFPDMVLAGAYPNNYKHFKYITVNAVMSEDHDLTRRFIQMSGSYADRLKNFTKEEQDLIYLFDFFLKEGEIRTVKDEKNQLNLAHFEESFTAKLIDMGRPKDVFDYQRWRAYKTAQRANRGQIFFQAFKPGIEIKPNLMQEYALDLMEDYVTKKIKGEDVAPFFLLNGMAGTGKTTIINMLLKRLVEEGKVYTTVVGAVANKAKQNIFHKLDKDIIRSAKVVESSISGILGKASSLNEGREGSSFQRQDQDLYGSAMKIGDGYKRGPKNIVIIDECSMIEDKDFDDLMKMAEDLNITMIFVGDSGQLPLIENEKQAYSKEIQPKKNSKVSKTFLEAHDDANVTLVDRVRQGEGNPILDASEKFYVTIKDAQKMSAEGSLNLQDLETTVTDTGAFIAKKKSDFDYDRDIAGLFKKAHRERNTSLVKYVCDTNKNVLEMNTKVRKSIYGNQYTTNFKEGDIIMLRDQYTAVDKQNKADILDNSTEAVILDHREIPIEKDKYQGYCSAFMLFCKKLNDWVEQNGENFATDEDSIDPELMRLWREFASINGRAISPIKVQTSRKLDGTTTQSLHNIFADVYQYSKRLKGKIKPVRTVELNILALGEKADEPKEYRAHAIHPDDWDIYEENIKQIHANSGKKDPYTGKFTSFIKQASVQMLNSYYGGTKTPSRKFTNFFGASLVDAYKNSRIRLQFGYAITSHKSQGSTYDVTIIDGDAISKANWGLADRKRMMYTAITRSSNITMVLTDQTWDNTDTEPLDVINDRINANKGNAKVDVANDTYVPEPEEVKDDNNNVPIVEDKEETFKMDGKDITIAYQQVNQKSDNLPEILNGKIMSYANTREDIIRQLYSDDRYTDIMKNLANMGFTREFIDNLLLNDDMANHLMVIKQYIETVYEIDKQQDNVDAVRERALREALIYMANTQLISLPKLTPMARAMQRLTIAMIDNKQHITFDEKAHKYFYDGQKNDYSITELVEAKNLNFDKNAIQQERLKRDKSKNVKGGAAIGNIADSQLRDMFAGKYNPDNYNHNPRITREVKQVYKQIKEKLDKLFPDGYYVETNEDALRLFARALIKDGNGQFNEKLIAGTMDMIVIDNNGDTWLFDFKTHKANNEDEITDTFGTKSRYNAQTSWYSDVYEVLYGIKIKGRNLLQINYLSDLGGDSTNPIEVTIEDDNYIVKDAKITGNIDVVDGPTNIHFHGVVFTPEVLTTSPDIISAIKPMGNSIANQAKALRKPVTNIFDLIAAREKKALEKNYPKLEPEEQPKPEIQGENISSKGSEFARKLTNPKNNLKVNFRGREFRNAEHAYLTWKSGEFDEVAYKSNADKPRGSRPVDKNNSFGLMVQILIAKLQQHPELIQGINERGGEEYLRKSWHSVTGDEFWEKQGGFIKALTTAYLIATTNLDIDNYVKFTESSGGYAQRTKENADWSDVTIAVAVDFTTAGERKTKSVAGDKYIDVSIEHMKPENVNSMFGQSDGRRYAVALKWKEKYPNGMKLNVAGNGIYTLAKKGITQENVDSYMDGFITGMRQEGVVIKEIRSGGQTGLDEAGVKAGIKHAIPVSIHAPKGYVFRNINNEDIKGEEKFKERFQETINELQQRIDNTKKAMEDNNRELEPEDTGINYDELQNPFTIRPVTVDSPNSLYNGDYIISYDPSITVLNNLKLHGDAKQLKEAEKMFLDRTISNLPIGARITVDTGKDEDDILTWGILRKHHRLFKDTTDYTAILIDLRSKSDAKLVTQAKKAGLLSSNARLVDEIPLYPFTYARSANEMLWSKLYDELNAKVPGKRLKALAVSAVYKISELVTLIQQGGNEDIFPENSRDKIRSLKGKKRTEIIEAVTLKGLAAIVREAYFNVNAKDDVRNRYLDNLNRKKTKEIVAIYDNFESFIRFGYAKLAALEGISVNETAVADQRMVELFDGEEESVIQELYGSSLEHWQVGFRSVSATMSLSQMIKEALNKFYEFDENNDIIYNEWGFEKRINATQAVSTMLSWFIGTESAEDMENKLREKASEHPWLLQLINNDPDLLDSNGREIGIGLLVTTDKNGLNVPLNESFRSKFFNNMHLYFTKYGIIKKNGDISIVNDKNVISMIAKDALTVTENNPELFKDGIIKGKAAEGENPTVADKILKLRIELNKKLKDKEGLQVDDELAEMIEDLFSLLGVTQFTTEEIKTIIGANQNHLEKIIQATSPSTGILKLFLGYNKDNKLIDKDFRSKYIKDIQTIVKPFQDFILDRAEAVTYQDGKLYYSYVLPSYLSEFNTRMKNDPEFMDKEFKSEFFGLMKDGKKVYLNEWQRKLAEEEQARKDFEHKVVLAANGKSYTKKTPKEYATSMLNEYFYDRGKRLAWYRMPMMSNKPSEEYIRFTRYATGYKDIITGFLVNTAMQEILRIADVLDRAERIESGLLEPQDKTKFYDINTSYIKDKEKRHTKRELLLMGIELGAGSRFVMLEYLQPFLQEALNNKSYSGFGKDLLNIILGETVDNISSSNISEPIQLFGSTTLDTLRKAIQFGMDKNFAEFMATMEAEGVITRDNNGNYTTDVNKLGTTNKQIADNLEEFFWNDAFASISIMQLYITDPVYYGNAEELQKRLAQLHAPGSRMNITATYKGQRYSDGVYRQIKLKDDKIISEVIGTVEKIFDRLIAENRNNRGHVAYYTQQKNYIIGELRKVNVTDAQTFCTPTAMRKKLGMLGEWTDEREAAYQRLVQRKASKSDLSILMLPLKPFMFGQKQSQDNNGLFKTRRVGIQVKTSEYLLVMADALIRNEGETSKLSAIFDVLEESLTDTLGNKKIPNGMGIDAISFESSIKTGLKAAIDINNLSNEDTKIALRKAIYAGSDGTNKTSLYNDIYVDQMDYRDYSIQQAVPTHFFGTQQLGSQSKALMFADMEEYERDENGAYKLDGQGNKIPKTIFVKDLNGNRVEMTVTEAKKEYFNLLSKSIEDSCRKLVKELNLDTADVRLQNIAISRLLKKQILEDARFGSDLLWAVDVNNNGDFNLPLSDPTHSTRIQQLLFSIIKERVYKQKIHGGPVVQVSNWGTENLHIRYTNRNGDTLMTEQEFNELIRDAKKVLNDKSLSENDRRALMASIKKRRSKFADVNPPGNPLNTYKQYLDYHLPGGGVYYECFAPIYDKRLLKYEDPVTGEIDIEQIREEEPQLLELIGYRIPTEAKYSMASLRIVGFLPREAGEGIMLPKEWTAISGSDFDVDKLYIMRRSFEYVGDEEHSRWEKGRSEINRDNDRIFDIMQGILESDQAKSKVVKIGTFDPLKVVGYKLAAIRENKNRLEARKVALENWWNGLENLTDLDLEVLTKKDKEINESVLYDKLPDDINKLKDLAIKGKNLAYNHVHLLFFKQNMVAGKLIGVFALANISHAYLSMYAIANELEKGIEIEGLKFKNFKLFDHGIGGADRVYFDPIYGFDGTPISDNIAAFLAASVDAVKDPILNLMNINMNTVNAAMVLARMGFNIELIGLLFGQDVVTRVAQRMDKFDETFENAIKAELDILAELISSNEELRGVDFSLDLNEKDLKDNLAEPKLQIDYTILSVLKQIHSIAEQTRSIIHMTRFNSISSAKGPDIINALIDRFKTRSYWEGLHPDNPTLTRAIDNPVLRTTRRESDMFEDLIFGDRFILAKPHFESAFKMYLEMTGLDINAINKKEATKFANFYVDYMINKVSNLFDFSYEHRLEVMSKYPRLVLAAKSDPKWADNKFVQSIEQRLDDKDQYIGIDINLRNLESDDIEDIKADFDEFADEDPETLLKIIEYMFNRGGFGFNPKTFTSLITNYIKQKYMGNYLNNVRALEISDDDLTDEFGNALLIDENGDDDVMDIVYQFLLHLDRKFPLRKISKLSSIRLPEGKSTKSLEPGDVLMINDKTLRYGIFRITMPNSEGSGKVIKTIKVDRIENGVADVTVVEKLGGDGQGLELNTRKEGIKSIYKKNKDDKDKKTPPPPPNYPDDPGPAPFYTEEEVDSADTDDANFDSLMDSLQGDMARNPRNARNLGSGYTSMVNNPMAGEGSYMAELLKANASLPVAMAMEEDDTDIAAQLAIAAQREQTTGLTSVNPQVKIAESDLKALGLLNDQQAETARKLNNEKLQCD